MSLFFTIAALLLLVPLACWLLFLGLLAGLSLLALARARKAPVLAARHPKLAVIIPAHDETRLIEATVRSVLASDYPPDRFAVTVVADNCTDDTALQAERAGAACLVRTDPDRRGKGYALQFGLEHVLADPGVEGVLFVDADTRLAPDFLERMARALEEGAEVVQGRYRVADSGRTWLTRLTAISIDLKHLWQHPGMPALGLSPALRGSGMCFARGVLDRFGWDSTSLTEDLDQSLILMEHGVPITYRPLAVNDQYMPPTLASAAEQRSRWSAGETQAGKTRLRAMFARAVRQQDFRALVQAAYLLAPPFSLNLLAAGLALVLAWAGAALGGPLWPGWLASAVFLLHAGYFLLGASETGFSAMTVKALCMIPVFAAWRILIHARACLPGRMPADWKRTPRV